MKDYNVVQSYGLVEDKSQKDLSFCIVSLGFVVLEKIVHVLDVINFVHPLWNSCNVYKVLCPDKGMNKNNKPHKSLPIKFYNKHSVLS